MWEPMTIDEYAEFETANGAELIKVDGVWWKSVRPFFYQPLFPFLEITPYTKKIPAGAAIGGFQHIVPDFATANSRRNYFVWDDIHNYSIKNVNHQRRNNIKKGINNFVVKEVADREEFISTGHPIYCSFYQRTGYRYKKERIDKEYFTQWAHTLYRFPKVKILGAYQRNELCAIDISYLVQDVLIEPTLFSKTECLKKRVMDALAHVLLERAAACSAVRLIFRGAVTGEKGVDESKLRRGCKIISKPAFYQINPLADILLRSFMRNNYKKLLGSMENPRFKEQTRDHLLPVFGGKIIRRTSNE